MVSNHLEQHPKMSQTIMVPVTVKREARNSVVMVLQDKINIMHNSKKAYKIVSKTEINSF
jgi:phenolic acid decarboxylase